MTRVTISVTSHLGSVTVEQRSEGVVDDDSERDNIAVTAAAALARTLRAYGVESKADPRPMWGTIALVEDLRRWVDVTNVEGLKATLLAAADRIEELSS